MSEMMASMAGGAVAALAGGAVAVVVIALLVGFTGWLRFLDDEAKARHGLKHHCHHGAGHPTCTQCYLAYRRP